MSFICAPHFLRIPCTRSRHTVTCSSDSHGSARQNKPTDPHPPPPQSARRKHPRSPRRNPKAGHIPKHVTSNHVTSSPDVWNSPIDDQPPPETIIQQSPQTPSNHPTKIASRARMASRQSKQPKPQEHSSAVTSQPSKKKRGRPKGSKSVNQSSMPQPQISPFMLAIRQDLRRRSIASSRGIVSDLFDFPSDEPVKWDDIQLSAPNGLPDGHDNTDLLQELLPIIAEQENDENRVATDDESRMKQLVSTCYTQFSSVHRFSDRLDNLKPYKLQEGSEQECQICSGTGMTLCEYCKGEGYVDLGENGEKFNPNFGNNVFAMPKRVTGNIYHCPLCGGMQQERCITCFGSGAIRNGKEVAKGESKQAKQERAWKVFDMKQLIEQEKDRIEIGLDGTIIMRAKRRGRPKKGAANADKPKPRKRRGRPPKSAAKSDARAGRLDGVGTEPALTANNHADPTSDVRNSADHTSGSPAVEIDQSVIPLAPAVVVPAVQPVRRTTDFVNTTDYQVGRHLSRQAPNIGNDFQGPSNNGSGGSLPQDDQKSEET